MIPVLSPFFRSCFFFVSFLYVFAYNVPNQSEETTLYYVAFFSYITTS